MLTKFSVQNFKGFKDKIEIDFSHPCNYEFNQQAIYDGFITKGLLFGPNGSGKSNLGYAIFDIVSHLTDKNREERKYECYLNLNGEKPYAEFEYTFNFEGVELRYCYRKKSLTELVDEHLYIDGKEMIYFDFESNEGYTELEGSQTLLPFFKNDTPISRVKYVSNNAILAETKENEAFNSFINFVNRMLFFYSLDMRGYQGFMIGSGNVAEGIVEEGKLDEFQQFLAENEIIYDLKEVEVDGHKEIHCCFDKQEVDFFKIASTGTKSMALFYYWYIKMKNASFVYMDEFDAFYHFELAESIVKKLRDIEKVQIFATTHNTDLLSNDLLRPDCYFIINNNKVWSLAQATPKELRKAHNLQKMYKAGAFDGNEEL